MRDWSNWSRGSYLVWETKNYVCVWGGGWKEIKQHFHQQLLHWFWLSCFPHHPIKNPTAERLAVTAIFLHQLHTSSYTADLQVVTAPACSVCPPSPQCAYSRCTPTKAAGERWACWRAGLCRSGPRCLALKAQQSLSAHTCTRGSDRRLCTAPSGSGQTWKESVVKQKIKKLISEVQFPFNKGSLF